MYAELIALQKLLLPRYLQAVLLPLTSFSFPSQTTPRTLGDLCHDRDEFLSKSGANGSELLRVVVPSPRSGLEESRVARNQEGNSRDQQRNGTLDIRAALIPI